MQVSSYPQYTSIQWSLRIKDTLGPAVLSAVERLSFSRRSKNVLLLWEMIILGYYIGGSFISIIIGKFNVHAWLAELKITCAV